MVKVVHILHSGVGGQSGVVFPLIGASINEACHVLAFYGVEALAVQNASDCRTLAVPYAYFRKCSGLGLRSQLDMADWIEGHEPDVIIAHSPATLAACLWIKFRRPRTRVISVEHHSNALKGRKHWILSAIALCMADRVVYLSDSYRAAVAKKLGKAGYRESKTVVIPNGLDLSDYVPAKPAIVAVAEHEIVIGMQGRMVAGKDFESLLRAFSMLLRNRGQDCESIRLELVGDGQNREALEQLSKSLGIDGQVAFLGMLARSSLIERMRQWSIFVLSSAGETMSMAVMEAMASGLPIIATDVPGVSDLIQHGETGVLVPFRHPEALANALGALINDPKRREALGRNARNCANSNFSATRSWARFRRLIGSLVKQSGETKTRKKTRRIPRTA